jgi:putative DeoR family transcriptional regulator (stage III sporulation protein D)
LDEKRIGIKAFAYIVKTVSSGAFPLKDYIEERAVELAGYIIETKATVRQTAKKFGISKSTVHKDITERLIQINPALATEARKVLDINKSERHIRGGLATKEKYLHLGQ